MTAALHRGSWLENGSQQYCTYVDHTFLHLTVDRTFVFVLLETFELDGKFLRWNVGNKWSFWGCALD